MSQRAQRVIDWCRKLAACSEDPGCTTRTFLSPPMHEVHTVLGAWMQSLGMKVSVDAAGNLRGTREGAAPRVMIASHLDTVPNAGAFDGPLGVILGIALCETASRAIEVIGFSEEEGVRLGVPFIGSHAVAGTLDAATRALAEPSIRHFGLDPLKLAEAHFSPDTGAYFEIHIEQGPVLESLNLPVGVVDAIAGQSRFEVTFEGQPNHAGTTPMSLRRDALVAAAEWILRVERYASAHQGLLATVGRIAVEPGAGNVIPGRATLSLDVRHQSDEVRQTAVRDLLQSVPQSTQLLDQPAVPMDTALTNRLAQAVEDAGYPVQRMTSGAGHDAMILAPHIPTAMLFVRTPGGISHAPEETVLPEDVEAALKVGERFLCLT
jgi:allantoate deiminase